MKVVLFGASGMVGQGALRECLLAPDVDSVLVIGRSPTGQTHEKLRELVHADFSDFSAIEGDVAGYDACFFCLGTSAAGMSEAEYTRVTHDLTLAAAQALLKHNPAMTFLYVSGAGTDSSEKGGAMWARVKGRTENALLALPFKAAFMFRPAMIQPLHGEVSKTKLYRVLYTLLWPLLPLFKVLLPGQVTTTERVGRAMLEVVRRGGASRVVENREINEIGGG
jgi:uncharacterized protein YbjT (DUF2867 family)